MLTELIGLAPLYPRELRVMSRMACVAVYYTNSTQKQMTETTATNSTKKNHYRTTLDRSYRSFGLVVKSHISLTHQT